MKDIRLVYKKWLELVLKGSFLKSTTIFYVTDVTWFLLPQFFCVCPHINSVNQGITLLYFKNDKLRAYWPPIYYVKQQKRSPHNCAPTRTLFDQWGVHSTLKFSPRLSIWVKINPSLWLIQVYNSQSITPFKNGDFWSTIE